MPAEEAEIVDDEFNELRYKVKLWRGLFIAALAVLVLLAVDVWQLSGRLQQETENNFQVAEWQTAYAQIVEQLGKNGVAKGQAILHQTVSGWKDLTPAEANVVFADWRGGEELRGGVIAEYLRNNGDVDNEAERIAAARAEIEAGWE